MKKNIQHFLFHLDNPHLFSNNIKKSLQTIIKQLTEKNCDSLNFLYKSTRYDKNKHETSEYLNDYFKLANERSIKPDKITYYYDYLDEIINKYHSNKENELIMLCGPEQKINEIALSRKYPNYVTMSEYCKLFPILVPISKRTKEYILSTKTQLLSRSPALKNLDFSYPFPIKAIFFLDDVTDWEEYSQVITDLLSSEDGNISKKLPEKPAEKHIPIYFSTNEFYSFDCEGKKILGLGALKETLDACYKLIYKKNLVFNELQGSPEQNIIHFLGNFFQKNQK